ncbi:MAG: DUF1761 domain-containing protein [bacterium]|nr:DUF1761 domain-containing protein [bacterium]MDE0600756.1 DUF1761 domain-containing protein [bacterium]
MSDLNWLAVLVAALAYFAVAAVWYQPKVMGTRWMKAVGVDPSQGSPSPWIFVGTFIAYFLMGTALAMIAQGIGASSFGDGLVLGLVTGVAFVGAQAWVNATYESRSIDLVITNGGIGVIGHVIMGVIVTVWT